MMMMFVIGFALGLIVTAIGLLMILQYQDKQDLKNRTGIYASTTKE
jgi:heme/copper-type cytochrome/quinol oxidase subunit 4